MQLDEQALQRWVIQVMDRAGEEDLVEEIRGKGARPQVRSQKMHLGPIAVPSLGVLDRHGVEVEAVVIELGERAREVAVRAPEIEQSAGWVQL